VPLCACLPVLGFQDFKGPGVSLAVCLLFVGMKCALAELTVNCLPISSV